MARCTFMESQHEKNALYKPYIMDGRVPEMLTKLLSTAGHKYELTMNTPSGYGGYNRCTSRILQMAKVSKY